MLRELRGLPGRPRREPRDARGGRVWQAVPERVTIGGCSRESGRCCVLGPFWEGSRCARVSSLWRRCQAKVEPASASFFLPLPTGLSLLTSSAVGVAIIFTRSPAGVCPVRRGVSTDVAIGWASKRVLLAAPEPYSHVDAVWPSTDGLPQKPARGHRGPFFLPTVSLPSYAAGLSVCRARRA